MTMSRQELKNAKGEWDPWDFMDELIDSFGIGVLSVLGDLYYVDPSSGSDGNDGKSPSNAYATMQTAIDACTTDNGDVIVRMPGGETVSSAITFDKSGITVIRGCFGGDPHEVGEKFSTYQAASYTTGPPAIITAPCSIIGLEFVTRRTAAHVYPDDTCAQSSAALAVCGHGGSFNGGFGLIKNCRFTDWWGNPYGIEFAAGAYWKVEGCTFESLDAGILFRATTTHNPDKFRIWRNRFVGCTDGIQVLNGLGSPHDLDIYDNVFIDTPTGIDTSGGQGDGFVRGNWFEVANTSAYDDTVANLQAQSWNFAGNHYTE